MTDTEAPRRARETPICDQCNAFAHPLPVKCRRGRKHFAHPGASLGTFVADHDHASFADFAVFDGCKGVFLAVKALSRAGELQLAHARYLHNRAFRGERSFQADHSSGRSNRIGNWVNHLLIGIPGDLFNVFANRLTGHRHRFGIDEAAIHECLHHHVNTARFMHVLCNILPARL